MVKFILQSQHGINLRSPDLNCAICTPSVTAVPSPCNIDKGLCEVKKSHQCFSTVPIVYQETSSLLIVKSYPIFLFLIKIKLNL